MRRVKGQVDSGAAIEWQSCGTDIESTADEKSDNDDANVDFVIRQTCSEYAYRHELEAR